MPDFVAEKNSNSLLVCGLMRSTSVKTLIDYFSKWGKITKCTVVLHTNTDKESKVFGSVTFDKADVIDIILKVKENGGHVIGGEAVEVKRGNPKELGISNEEGRKNDSLEEPEEKSESTSAAKDQAAENDSQSGPGKLGKKFMFAGVIIVIAAICIKLYASQHPGSKPNFDYINIYKNGLHKLQEDFKNQTDRFWKILRSRGLAHLRNTSPPQPLVLLIVAPPSTHSFVDCFTKRLAMKLDPQYPKQLNVISGKEYTRSSGHETKKVLDNKLKKALQSGHRAAVISNLELLPSPSPLLFYSYCDNKNAPFKQAAILFTVHLPREPSPSLAPVKTEGLVRNFLSKEVWADGAAYDLDAVAALLSRIAGTVVVLSGEDEKNLESVCDSFSFDDKDVSFRSDDPDHV